MLTILGDALLLATRGTPPRVRRAANSHVDWTDRFSRPETLAEQRRGFSVQRDLFW